MNPRSFVLLFFFAILLNVFLESHAKESPPAGETQSAREALAFQAPNITAWAVSELDTTIPPDLRRNLTFLRESMLDEVRSASPSSAASYKVGDQLCRMLIDALDEHDRTAIRAGYRLAQANANPNMKVTSPDLEARRDWKFMRYWPQYHRERDQRNEIQRQQNVKSALFKESVRVEWANRAAMLRRNLDEMYARYRDSLRKDPTFQGQGNPVAVMALPAQTEGVPPEVQDLFTPAFQALPAAERIERVKSRMLALNAGMSTKVDLRITPHGVRASCRGKAVSNVWPLRAIPDLITLFCKPCNLADLTPLTGLPLERVSLRRTQVKDLSPLRGMKLTVLVVANTAVDDLSPLRGMPVQILSFSDTKVTQLEPLKDMPALREISCDFVPERDTDVLRSLKTLEKINGYPVAAFWKQVEAGKLPKGPVDEDDVE